MQLQRLPISLALMVLSTVVKGVPIGSTTDDAEPTAIWVTETVWPCEPSSLGAATGIGNVQKADYDTVPVDGGSNAEAVPEGAAESSPATTVAASDPPMTSSSVDPVDPTTVDPTTNDPPPSTTTPAAMLYTPVASDPMTVDPPSTHIQLDVQSTASNPIVSDPFTSDPVSADPTIATPVPVFSMDTPDAFVAPTTSIPPMPTLAPTFLFRSNGTNTTCTDDPNDEYTPAEESAYWATASGPSVSYSDYTTTITIKSTSTTTISITIPAEDPTAAAADPMPTAMNNGFYSNTTVTTSADPSPLATVDPNQAVVYTPVSDAFASTMEPGTSADPTTSTNPMTPPDPTTSPTTTSPTPTSTEPSEETISGTIITYIDDTTTITTTPTPDPSAPTDSTSTTTVWTTSTIIIDSYAKRARRRHVLVTRS